MRSPCTPATPTVEALLGMADRCVQCGLCLPRCPTYAVERSEAESPRGRIQYARAVASGQLPPTAGGDAHLDACLGCGRCEAACPAGVPYGALLDAARAGQRQRRAPGWRQRLAEGLAARPRRFDRVLGAYRAAWPLLPWRPLPRPPAAAAPLPATGGSAVFVGCVARRYEGPAREALARLAAALGEPLCAPAGQGCCGALHRHAGDPATADALAAANRAAFAGQARVLTLATGCHAAVADALAGDGAGPRPVVDDALAWLAARAAALPALRASSLAVALHRPCSQSASPAGPAALDALLARIPGLRVVALPDAGCCGAGGTRALLDPAGAARHAAPLLDALRAAGADRLLSTNIGCRLHLTPLAGVPVQHPLDFLAEHLP